jgi:enoyl-[acyl-carrier protein] reductase III
MSDDVKAMPGLQGRVALVTGATRGVGLAIARKLAASGCHVLVNHRGPESTVLPVIRSLESLGGRAEAVRADVSRPAEVSAMMQGIGDRHGHLDVLVHNAATMHPASALQARSRAVVQDMSVAVAPLLAAAPLLPALMGVRGGRVLAISSTGARAAVPGYVHAGMAKAALESLVRYLAAELAGHRITVNAISAAKIDKGDETTNPGMLKVLAQRTPAGRLTKPTDVADAVALLCADEAAWIHGQTLVVDGGLSIMP